MLLHIAILSCSYNLKKKKLFRYKLYHRRILEGAAKTYTRNQNKKIIRGLGSLITPLADVSCRLPTFCV